jgi:hypothetical protein
VLLKILPKVTPDMYCTIHYTILADFSFILGDSGGHEKKINQCQRGKDPNRKSDVAFATIFRIIKGFMEASLLFFFSSKISIQITKKH